MSKVIRNTLVTAIEASKSTTYPIKVAVNDLDLDELKEIVSSVEEKVNVKEKKGLNGEKIFEVWKELDDGFVVWRVRFECLPKCR